MDKTEYSGKETKEVEPFYNRFYEISPAGFYYLPFLML
jgi:hypothetical protein